MLNCDFSFYFPYSFVVFLSFGSVDYFLTQSFFYISLLSREPKTIFSSFSSAHKTDYNIPVFFGKRDKKTYEWFTHAHIHAYTNMTSPPATTKAQLHHANTCISSSVTISSTPYNLVRSYSSTHTHRMSPSCATALTGAHHHMRTQLVSWCRSTVRSTELFWILWWIK